MPFLFFGLLVTRTADVGRRGLRRVRDATAARGGERRASYIATEYYCDAVEPARRRRSLPFAFSTTLYLHPPLLPSPPFPQ